MTPLVCGVDEEARPDAVLHARIDGRAHLHFVDSPAAAATQSGHDSRLSIDKTLEYWINLITIERFERRGSLRANARRRFEDPGKKAPPEIDAIGCAWCLPSLRSVGDYLLPDREIGIGACIEMLNALRGRPGSGFWRREAHFAPGGSQEFLNAPDNGSELAFQLVERFGAPD